MKKKHLIKEIEAEVDGCKNMKHPTTHSQTWMDGWVEALEWVLGVADEEYLR